MYEEIEKILDNILNSKTLFDIDKDSNLLYEKIKNKKNEENLNQEKNNEETNSNEENKTNQENDMNNNEEKQSEIDEIKYVDKEEIESVNVKKDV